MVKAKKSKASYSELSEELEAVISELQRDDIDVEVALDTYRRGLEIVREIEAFLRFAQNEVTELQATFSKISR